MPYVNGHDAEHGCYIDGHWGQYGLDRLADIAEDFGWKAASVQDDPRIWRRIAERRADRHEPDPSCGVCGAHVRFDASSREHRGESGFCVHNTPTWPISHAWECAADAAADIEEWLNDRTCRTPTDTADHHVWHWSDGEFFLSPLCGDDDCDDPTCAHWD